MFDWDDIKELAQILVLWITVLVLVLGSVGIVFAFGGQVVNNLWEKGGCTNLQLNDSEHVYHWDIWNGCLVKTVQGYWMFPEEVTNGNKNLYINEGEK